MTDKPTDLPSIFNNAIIATFPDGGASVNEVTVAAVAILSAYVGAAPLEHRSQIFRAMSAQLREAWGLDAPTPALGEARAFPDYLRPIETEDCNVVVKNGDGGATDLHAFQWGNAFTRVAYFVPKHLRLKLRNERAVVSVVVKTGPGGFESISAKIQEVELTTEH